MGKWLRPCGIEGDCTDGCGYPCRDEKGAYIPSPGDEVYVVERDECGDAYGVSGYIFLAQAGQGVIVSPFIDGCATLEETLKYRIKETAGNYHADLLVFPADDCYNDRDSALTAYYNEAEAN